uniref:Uncharacterized protein n=1 Tax=Cacopsylla melanoneura TaxID=428564 RepID=A0A8D8YY63_9HEMI
MLLQNDEFVHMKGSSLEGKLISMMLGSFRTCRSLVCLMSKMHGAGGGMPPRSGGGGGGGGQFRSAALNGVASNGGGMGSKKMRKRKELDALVSHPSATNGQKRLSLSRSRHTDQLLAESTDDEFYWSSSGREKTPNSGFGSGRSTSAYLKRSCAADKRSSRRDSWKFGFLRACSFMFVFTCIVATCSVLYLFLDIRQQCAYLRHELDEGENNPPWPYLTIRH